MPDRPKTDPGGSRRPKTDPGAARRPKTDPGLPPPAEGPGRLARRFVAASKHGVDLVVGNHWVTGALFIASFTLLLSLQECGISYPDYQVGDIAPADIAAPYEVTVAARGATEARREEMRAAVLRVYNFESMQQERGRSLLVSFFEMGRGFQPPPDADPSGTTEALRGMLPLPVDDDALALLRAEKFSPAVESLLLDAYDAIGSEKVIDSRLPLRDVPAIRLREPGGVELVFRRIDTILDLEEARNRVLRAFRDLVARADRRRLAPLEKFLRDLVNPNLTFDPVETESRRVQAAASVTPLMTTLPRGKMIIRSGEEFTEADLEMLRQIEAARTSQLDVASIAGSLILAGLMAFFLWRYVTVLQRHAREVENLFGMFMILGTAMILLTSAGLMLAEVLAESIGRAPFHRALPYQLAIPLAAGAMLVALLAHFRAAMIFSIFFAVAFGMLAQWDLKLTTYALISSFAGIYGIAQYKQRTAIIKAGMVVGAVNALTVVALGSLLGSLQPLALLFDMACGFAGGILVAIAVSSALPVAEWIFSVLTDIRLLELSNLNSPLLRRLAVLAPGTYNHSVLVGTLAESAAQAIGINSLLCRVAAYYHDIGKMNKPEYFIENQMDATGRHAKLSPTMSSLIIASHVKDGIKMAQDYNLPKPIVDIIPQHHGTRLITYFFKKAKKLEDPEIQEVSESSFRYPGPKPQSKEAAIFMMADSVEAASRTVDDPTPAKFKDVIRKIVNAVIMDDQLTETDLTFSDLEQIQESFQKTLCSIYHHRIEYPGFKFEERPGRDRLTLPG